MGSNRVKLFNFFGIDFQEIEELGIRVVSLITTSANLFRLTIIQIWKMHTESKKVFGHDAEWWNVYSGRFCKQDLLHHVIPFGNLQLLDKFMAKKI